MGLLDGKKAVIFGIANEKSIAWAIAQAFRREGAELAVTYANETVAKRVIPLAESIGASLVLPCDVRNDAEIKDVFAEIGKAWGGIDTLVHSIAFGSKEELKGSFLNTTREGFALALDVSAYSLIALMKEAHPLMAGKGGSAITLTYYGGQKVFPSYNVMGVAKAALEMSVRYLAEAVGGDAIRVNAISAGPVRTLAGAGISDSRQMLAWQQRNSPLRRTVTIDEIGGAAVYLLSDFGSGVTGEIHHVDSGYHIVSMPVLDELKRLDDRTE